MCVHVPFVTDSTEPYWVAPETTGAVTLTGTNSVIASAFELAEAEPATFVAVTTARTEVPSSASTSV